MPAGQTSLTFNIYSGDDNLIEQLEYLRLAIHPVTAGIEKGADSVFTIIGTRYSRSRFQNDICIYWPSSSGGDQYMNSDGILIFLNRLI